MASLGTETCSSTSSSPLCGTGYYANDTICEVVGMVDFLACIAEEARKTAEEAIEELSLLADEAAVDVEGVDYNPDLTGVDYTFTPPTAVVVPAAPYADATTIDDRFNDALAKQTEVQTGRERDSQQRAARNGIGMASSALAIGLINAEEQGNREVSQVGLAENIKYVDWLREDTKVRTQQLITYHEQELARELEKRGWEQMEITTILTKADREAFYELEKVRVLNEVLNRVQEAVAQLQTGLAQSIYSAIHANLTGQGIQSSQISATQSV